MNQAPIDAAELPSHVKKSWYTSPWTQIVILSLVCFLCPGMFNALTGMGGGGRGDAKVSNNGLVAVYSTFAATSVFAGSITNRLGARWTLALGAAGYPLYIGSFLHLARNDSDAFVIGAGIVVGACAGLLWTAQGTLILSIPTEGQKGRAFALFWTIFNLGAVLGSAIQLGLTWSDSTETVDVSSTVYAVFVAISALGVILPIFLINPGRLVRTDGSRVVLPLRPSWRTETIGLYKCLRQNLWILLLFPYFLASNWFYTWQFNCFNGALFTLRTRSLNNMLYWLTQILSAIAFGMALDSRRVRRTVRAWMGLLFVAVVTMCVWGGSRYFQRGYTRHDLAEPRAAEFARIDLKDSDYFSHVIIYISMGVLDATWQAYAYWLMGAFSNDSSQLSHLVGFYKAIQSAGAAGVFRLDANLAPYLTQLAVSWALCGLGVIFLIPVLWLRATDKTPECVVRVECTVDVEVSVETRSPDEERVEEEKEVGSLDLETERRRSEARSYHLDW